jgi:hypothetical protein
MEKFKKAKVVMLPTNQSNIVLITSKTEFMIGTEINKSLLQGGKDWIYNSSITDNSSIPQQLYITSDDEIEKGDWVTDNINIIKVNTLLNFPRNLFKKIIATTDTPLSESHKKLVNINEFTTKVVDNLPQPSQQFIEKYIESYNKGIILSDVLVEYEEMTGEELGCDPAYYPLKQRLKLKINPDNTINIKIAKETYNREEVRGILIKFHNEFPERYNIDKWIEENL